VIDSHTHLDACAPPDEELVARAAEAGVTRMVTIGTDGSESAQAIAIAGAHEGVWATVGLHPHDAKNGVDSILPVLDEGTADGVVVAIGECGLDFNRNYSPHPDQEKWFVAQLELGLELGKPLFLHSRDAHPRFAEILREHSVRKAVAHCFTGEAAELRAYLDLDLYIGITGWICDERRGKHLLALVREIPRERLLLETDAPYLTPRDLRPQPKARRNEPAFLPHILRAVARAVGRTPEELAEETTRNARTLFSLHESGTSAVTQRPLAA
jgi:TatD DNase family protein